MEPLPKTPFEKERRYLAFKLSDLGRALSDNERVELYAMHMKVNDARGKQGLPIHDTITLDDDWHCYVQAWQLLQAEVEGRPMTVVCDQKLDHFSDQISHAQQLGQRLANICSIKGGVIAALADELTHTLQQLSGGVSSHG